jgi:hypothetical protein
VSPTVAATCARCASPLESGDLRCAICSLPAPFDPAAHGQIVAEVLRCRGCGAAVEYDVKVQAPRCAFCGEVTQLERSQDPIERAELYLPFRIEPVAAQAALRAWLGSRGFFRPRDLATRSTVQALVPIWWVAWIFDTEALVSWTADSDYGHGRSSWAPQAGQSPLELRAVLVSASRGLTYAEAGALAPHFDLSSAEAAPRAMPGAHVERFDVQRSAARHIVASAVEAATAANAVHWITGRHYRNLRVAVLLQSLVTRRLALPSYVLAYRYGGKLFRVVVHGQDARCILGDSPVSKWKVVGVIAAMVGVMVLIMALVALVSAFSH